MFQFIEEGLVAWPWLQAHADSERSGHIAHQSALVPFQHMGEACRNGHRVRPHCVVIRASKVRAEHGMQVRTMHAADDSLAIGRKKEAHRATWQIAREQAPYFSNEIHLQAHTEVRRMGQWSSVSQPVPSSASAHPHLPILICPSTTGWGLRIATDGAIIHFLLHPSSTSPPSFRIRMGF